MDRLWRAPRARVKGTDIRFAAWMRWRDPLKRAWQVAAARSSLVMLRFECAVLRLVLLGVQRLRGQSIRPATQCQAERRTAHVAAETWREKNLH